MTVEEAIRILDPSTTLEALVEIEYYGGFNGKLAQIKACEKACEIACEALRAQQEQTNDPLTLDELRRMRKEPISHAGALPDLAKFLIERFQAADVDPVVHGKWYRVDDWTSECSVCGFAWEVDPESVTNYCPSCGAKMDGGGEHE